MNKLKIKILAVQTLIETRQYPIKLTAPKVFYQGHHTRTLALLQFVQYFWAQVFASVQHFSQRSLQCSSTIVPANYKVLLYM